jgi:hypothetical protein
MELGNLRPEPAIVIEEFLGPKVTYGFALDGTRHRFAFAGAVLLTSEREFDAWLDGPIDDAIELQRPCNEDEKRF